MSILATEQRLSEVLAATRPILLDFDGPVTPLYIDGRNQLLADRMRAELVAADIRLPDEVAATADPLAVLRWCALHVPEETASHIERLSTAGEVEFAQKAHPNHRGPSTPRRMPLGGPTGRDRQQ